MVGKPGIQRRMKQPLIVEITIAAVDREPGGWDSDEVGARPAADHLMLMSRSDHDHLVPEPRRGAKLRFDVGSNATARGRVEGADVNDTHRFARKRSDAVNFK